MKRYTSPERIRSFDIKEFSSPWQELLGDAEHDLLPERSVRFQWEGMLERLAARSTHFTALCEDLIRQNENLGVEKELLAKIEKVFSGSGGAVIAGQQPGLFGGPLFTFYKAATCVLLADLLEDRYGVPILPVFWNAGDDDDFQEVRSCSLIKTDGGVVKVEAPSAQGEAGLCVGDVSSDRLKNLLTAIQPVLSNFGENGRRVLSILEESIEVPRWGDHFSNLLVNVFNRRLLVYDARSIVWRQEAAPLVSRFIDFRQRALKKLGERNSYMLSMGIPIPIPERTLEIPLTLVEQGVRKKFSAWDEIAMRRQLREAPSRLSPTVALRSVLQDALFPAIASVVGPGEIHYLSQISPLYEVLGVSEPIRVPRFSSTFIPRGGARIAEELGVSLKDIFLEWDRTKGAYVYSTMPEGFYESVERFSRSFSEEARGFAAVFRNDVKFHREIDKIARRIASLRKRGEESHMAVLKGEGLDLSLIGEYMRPNGALQERVLTFFLPVLEGGTELLKHVEGVVVEHIERLQQDGSGHYLIVLSPM